MSGTHFVPLECLTEILHFWQLYALNSHIFHHFPSSQFMSITSTMGFHVRFLATVGSLAFESFELLTSQTHQDLTLSLPRHSRYFYVTLLAMIFSHLLGTDFGPHSGQSLYIPLTFQDLSNLAWLSLSGSPSLSLQSGALLPLTGLRTAHLADLGWTRIDRFCLILSCHPTCHMSHVHLTSDDNFSSRDLVQIIIFPGTLSSLWFSIQGPGPDYHFSSIYLVLIIIFHPGTWSSGRTCTPWTLPPTLCTATASSPGSETSLLQQVVIFLRVILWSFLLGWSFLRLVMTLALAVVVIFLNTFLWSSWHLHYSRQHLESRVCHPGQPEWEGSPGLASWPSQVCRKSNFAHLR